MKLGLLILVLLFVPVVSALTPQEGCCIDFEKGLELHEECAKYEINETTCNQTDSSFVIILAAIIAGYAVYRLTRK